MPGLASPTTVFCIIEYLGSVFQVELAEAGGIDGAGEFYFQYDYDANHGACHGCDGLGFSDWQLYSFLVPFIPLRKMELYTTPRMTMNMAYPGLGIACLILRELDSCATLAAVGLQRGVCASPQKDPSVFFTSTPEKAS